MNDLHDTPTLPGSASTTCATNKPTSCIEAYVRQNPASALIAAAGLGMAAVLIARVLIPEPPQSRAARLLEEIQERLGSAYGHAAHIADEGSQAMGKGMDAMHLDQRMNKLSRGFRSLFY